MADAPGEGDFVVYLTWYKGDLLPPFYVGSSSYKKIINGYFGSVSSKKWKSIYRAEIRQNPELFSTTIVKYFKTRLEATVYEAKFQTAFNVVKSPLFINQAIAIVGALWWDKAVSKKPKYGLPSAEACIAGVKEANSGKCTVIDTETGLWCKVKVEDFWSDSVGRYKAFEHTDRSKKLISENTSESMKALVESGEHWFQSTKHKKLLSKLRTGVVMSKCVRDNLSRSRLKSFETPWNLPCYSFLDFNKALDVVEWSEANYVKGCSRHRSTITSMSLSLGLTERAAIYLCRHLCGVDSRKRILDIFKNYVKEKSNG